MRTKSKLTDGEVDHKELDRFVRFSILQLFDGNRKEWHRKMRQKVADFPAWRTLYDWTERSSRREKRSYNALMSGLRLTRDELEELPDVDAARVVDSMGECVVEENDLYFTINKIIDRLDNTKSGSKIIQVCAMHGTDHSRLVDEPSPPQAWKGFVKRMWKCIAARSWRVEVLYNVPSKDRLEQIKHRLDQAVDAEKHEVRAYGIAGSVPMLCPLIVGDRDVFLGLSHPRFYRGHHALYLQGKRPIAIAKKYWTMLWNNAKYVIRNEAGVDLNQLRKLEEEIDASLYASPVPRRRTASQASRPGYF